MTADRRPGDTPAVAGDRANVHGALRRAANPWFWVYLSCAAFGGLLVWVVGHRGIYLYDQSGVFDGGWRMLQGQVMYRDFFAPYGPMVFWIQSWFLRLAGVDYSSMVLPAAVLNSVAVACVIWLVRRLLPDPAQRLTAAGAGLLTAIWFQAPSGTLWFEQTGFCFNLIATALLVEARFRSDRVAAWLRVAAGSLLAAAVLSKQTAGVVLLPVPLGVVLITARDWKKAVGGVLQVGGGIALVIAAFVTWLWTYSSFSGFWNSVVVMSRILGASRVGLVPSVPTLVLLTTTFPWVRTAVATLFACAVISPRTFSRRETVLAIWIALGYIVFQNIFASLTFNETFNSLGYLGLINGLSFGLLIQVFKDRRVDGYPRLARWAATAVLLLAALILFGRPMLNGWRIDIRRYVQGFDQHTSFDERLKVPRASRVRWGEPTILEGVRVTRQDFEALNAWLEAADVNFFVFGSSTLLYGLHERVSPQPWLYLTPDHSFPATDSDRVGATIVESLKGNRVGAIVIERLGENTDLLERMPAFETWLHAEFERVAQFGLYDVWILRLRRAGPFGRVGRVVRLRRAGPFGPAKQVSAIDFNLPPPRQRAPHR